MRYATSTRSVPPWHRSITQRALFCCIQEKLKKEKTDKKAKKVRQISEKSTLFMKESYSYALSSL